MYVSLTYHKEEHKSVRALRTINIKSFRNFSVDFRFLNCTALSQMLTAMD